MNKNFYRIVFNAARGMRMVVQETATSAGKATGATAAVAVAALASILISLPSAAQIVGAPNVPGTLRPTVLVAPNGVPLVNIQTPSAAGVSRNVYNQFDVGANGAILNNSRTTALTQLGGYVQGNPSLATGPARIILNEINSGNPSQLRGYIEVGGSRAEVIIANPAGINVDGGGFINASRATLTTGTPQFGAMGSLDSFLVRGGTVTVNGAGLDLSTTDYAAILARAVNVNAAIYATDLKVVAGANQVSADHAQITPTAGTGPAPTFSLDVSALGGMYARKIMLVGTEAGLGVRNAGSIGASAGNLIVTAAGRLENTGTLEGQSVQLTTPGDIDNRGGTIRQTSSASLAITAPTLSNTNGGWIGTEPVPVSTGSGTLTGAGSVGTTTGGAATGTASTGTGGASTGATAPTATAYVPPEPGAIAAGGAVLNDGGKIYAGGPLTLQTQNLVNNGGTLSVASMALNQPSFSNQGGTLNVSGALTANVDSFDNSTGTLHAGSLNIATSGDLLNVDGTLTSDSDANFGVGGKVDNTRGTISATGTLAANVAGAVNNTAGKLASNQTLTLRAGSLEGTQGNLQTAGDLSVTTAQALIATGSNVAGGNASLTGASVDVSGSQTGAANIAIAATQGNVTTSGATIATPGTLAVTAYSQAAQTLINSDGKLSAGQLQINASNLANTNGGEIVQTGTGATTIAVSGTLNNDGGHIATNGQDLTLQAASITNTAGKIDHAGTGTLTIAGGSFNGANGAITGNGALAVNVTGAFNQEGGNTYAQQIDITAGSLSNQSGGRIVQGGTGTTTVNVAGALNNSGGTLASAGAINATAGSMSNQAGKVQAAGISDLHLTVANQLDNSAAGQILAGGNTTVQAGSLINDNGGKITAVGDLNATVSGAASNQSGTIAANGNTTLSAATFNNNSGTTAAVEGDLKVTTTGATTNVGGTLQAGGATTLSNAGLDSSSGKIYSQAVSIDTHGQQFTNSLGTLAATDAVNLQTGTLVNAAGLIQSGGAMTVDTHGQGLTNTNAAGYVNGQGGIASAGTLTLNAGAVNNDAGFIGSKDVLVASTKGFSNTGGGLVLGQADVSVNTNGATYDNTGGQTQAVGALTITAGGVQNASGLIRAGTTTVNAGTLVNASTSGANQGIEGTNVALNVGNLNNQAGAVRADQNVTVTSGGTVDNSAGGLLSAGDTLKVVDPNALNPAAKTLNLINTNGTLVANNSVQIDAKTFSGDGTLVSGKDLSLALTQDIVNNAKVIANGSLSYGTTGNLTNNGQLIAGDTLTVSGNTVTNTANAEMSGKHTTVNAGTLINRGLIDSQGLTRINAGAVNNVGSGRIYGNHVAIATGTLTNDTETVNGVTQAGTIAARQRLDIAAATITNREHALIFSGGDMGIGGALDANSVAVGSGGTLNNLSARIESLGNMSVAMGSINNFDTHLQLGPQTTTTKLVNTIAPIGGSGFYTLDQVVIIFGQPYVWARNPDGSAGALLGSSGYGIWNTAYTTTADTAMNADPASIVSGGDMTLTGAVYNRDSRIIAGGTLTAANVTNEALKGQYRTTAFATVYDDKGAYQGAAAGPTTAGKIDVGAFEYVDHVNGTSGTSIGAAVGGATGANGGGAGQASGGARNATFVEVAANVGTVLTTGGPGTGALVGTSAGAGTTVPTVVRTSTPTLTLPQASLYRTNPGSSHYLIETDPRFANYRTWLSSDYLLNNLGLDPNNILKRLGDGFYEQQLINQQIAQLTGYRYVDGYDNDQDQYTALMNAGVTFAQQYGLAVGVALSAAQMAQLTSDIVWLVEQTVTLPDGSSQRVLVPQVYVRVRPGDIDGSGALLAGNKVNIDGAGNNLVNTGTIAGRQLVSINANTIDNLGGRISGGQVGLKAAVDINNVGGTIDARDKLVLDAGRDITVRTTTESGSAGNVNIDRVAGLYVSNPGGTLVASAGRDVNLIGAIVANAGSGATAIGAKNDINLGTVSTSGTASASGKSISGRVQQSTEVGTRLSGGGSVTLDAGHDVNARAATVAAGGDLSVKAGNDIKIESGRATTDMAYSATRTDKGLLKKTEHQVQASASSDTAIGSSFTAGKDATFTAGNDFTVVGGYIAAQDKLSISATRDVNILADQNTSSASISIAQQRSSTGLGKFLAGPGVVASLATGIPDPAAVNLLTRKQGTDDNAQTNSQVVGSTLSAGNIGIRSGRDTTISGSTLVADNDVTVNAARNLTIRSAESSSATDTDSTRHTTGNAGTFWKPAVGTAQSSGEGKATNTTQVGSRIASLNGNVKLTAGGTYTQTASEVLALDTGVDGKAGNIEINAKTVVINEGYDTTSRKQTTQGSQLTVGGTLSVPIVNAARSAVNTAQASTRTNDARVQALGAATAGYQGYQAYQQAAATYQNSAQNPLGYKVGAALTNSHSSSTSTETSSTAVGSTVWAAGNVRITATGGGADSNITATGATLSGSNVTLEADNAVTLLAAQNTTTQSSSSSGSKQSLGASYSVGAQNGFTIDVGASQSKGSGNGRDVTQVNTYVDADNTVTIRSGGNTTLSGAVLTADHVKLDVGGDLNITSLQDTSTSTSKQGGSGFDMSLCVIWCAGTPVMGSVSGSTAKGNGNYASVNESSGIQAGDGGFQVSVKGNTNLTGGVIASTQEAVDANVNRFATGSMTTSDVVNVDSGSASGLAITAGYQSGNSFGIGSAGGSNTSITPAGISGIAGNSSVRTGDSSNGLSPSYSNLNGLLQDVNAQVTITAAFGQSASDYWGKFANDKYAEAVKNGDSEAAACWAPDGGCRAGGHTIIGALTGGINGAVGAAASSLYMPDFVSFLRANDMPEVLVQAITLAASGGLGAITGGSAGAAGAYNEAGNNVIVAVPLIIDGIVYAGAAAISACLLNPKCVELIGKGGTALLQSIITHSEGEEAAPTGSTGVSINEGQQGKHVPEHNNYIPGRSDVTDPNPQALLDKGAGTGEQVGKIPVGQAGSKERVDFGKDIGNYVDPETGESSPTSMGIIHYGTRGAHIVPARPRS